MAVETPTKPLTYPCKLSVLPAPHRMLLELVKEHQQKQAEEGASWQPRDLLDVFLALPEEERLSERDMLWVLLDLLNACELRGFKIRVSL